MKKATFLFFITLGAVFLFHMQVSAVPVESMEQIYTQPVGVSFTGTPYGDEYLYYILAQDDYVVVPGSNQFWYYATVSACEEGGIIADKLQPSGFRYGIDPAPPLALRREDLNSLSNLYFARAMHEQTATTYAASNAPTTQYLGAQQTLVIRVSFKDVKLKFSDVNWHDHLFGSDYYTVRGYYEEVSRPDPQSDGQIKIVPATAGEMQGDSDDTGVVHIDVDCFHPSAPTGDSLRSLLKNTVMPAVETANIVDFSQYDTNGDMKISTDELHLLFVFAGYEVSNNAGADAITGHQYAFANDAKGNFEVFINGVQLYTYMAIGEQMGSGNICTIGTICHEMGHDMGLPDLYDDKSNASSPVNPDSNGIGDYGLMGYGCLKGDEGTQPTHLCAFCKIQLGIIEPFSYNPLYDSQTYTLRSFDHSAGYNVLKILTGSKKEYFLVENRWEAGYDYSLHNQNYSNGIAIWHVNEKYKYNVCYGQRLVDLEEADETSPGQSPLDQGETTRGDSLYYAGGKTAFGPSTQPSNQLDSGSNANFTITVQSASGSAMQVKLETWLDERVLEPGIYRFNKANDDEYRLMAMQSTPNSPSFETQTTLTDNQVNWFVTTYSSGEDQYNRIAPFAYPDQYLCYENGSFYLSEYADNECQRWKLYTLGDQKYLKPRNQVNYVYIRSDRLVPTNDPDEASISYLKYSAPIYFKENNKAVYGNLHFSDEAGAKYIDADLRITSRPAAETQIWYVSKAAEYYCTIAPAEQPDLLLTHTGGGGVTLTQRQTGSDAQLWSLCMVDGRLQLRPKNDLERAVHLGGESLSAPWISSYPETDFSLAFIRSADVPAGGRFYFDYRLSGQVLDAENFGLEDGTAVQKYPFNGASNQRWRVVAFNEESCILSPEYDPRLVLGVEKSTNRVVLCQQGSSDYMVRWKIVTRGRTCRIIPYDNSSSYLAVSGNTVCLAPVYDGVGCDWVARNVTAEDLNDTLQEGVYRLRNVGSSLLLHGNGSINNHNIYQESGTYGTLNMQVWLVEKTDDGYYCLRSGHDPKVCVTYDASLQRCTLVPYTGSDYQKWSTLQESGSTGFRFVLKGMPGHVLVVRDASTAPYADLIVFGDNGTDNGKWIAEPTTPQRIVEDQTCLLSNHDSGLVMDAQNFSTQEGTRILQWSKNYGTNQRWIIKWEADGYYRLSPAYAENMYLSAADDGKVRLTYNGDGDNAKWLFLAETADGSSCRLTPKFHPGKVAVVQYASKSEGEEIILYDDNGSSNGYWSLTDRHMELTSNMYRMRNNHAGLYLGAESSTGPAQGVTLDQSYAFEMWAVYAGNGFYRFSPYKYSCTLKAFADGVTVSLGEETPADPDAELWFVGEDGRIHSKKYPSRVLALKDDASAAGTQVILVEEHTAQSETWTFESLS